jgi:putative ABC transport system permease protein
VSLLDAIRLALSQLRVQKLKSFFSLLGVAIGVMFLIAVVSIVEGMGRYMERDLVGKIMGVNTFELRRRPNIQLGDVTEAEWRSWQRRRRLYESDVQPVAEALPAGVRYAVYSEDNAEVVSAYARPRSVRIVAADPAYLEIKQMGLTSGRAFGEQEAALGTPVVIIGKDVKEHFFPTVEAVGRELRIAGFPYTVVGVAEPQGSVFGLSLDKFIIGPRESPLARVTNPHGIIDAIMIQTPSGTGMDDSMERVRQVMRQRRHLRPAQPDDFSLQTSESALAFWNKLKSYLVLAGVALPAIGLVVGAIVIMNIMLVAVAERTREIGIRKSLGARRRDILAQFLVESATLSTVGAAAGVGVGVGLAQLVAAVSPLPAAIKLWAIVVAVLLGGGVGIIAGVYPASRASRLDPVVALRAE